MQEADVLESLNQINQAWLDGRPEAMLPLIHPEITMVIPGFAGRIRGSEAFVAGFKDFCEHAPLDSFHTSDHQTDLSGDTAVASYRFEMVYEREGVCYHATGRDLWVFGLHEGKWLAVWRTMLDVAEQTA
jgi:hypothetical protein